MKWIASKDRERGLPVCETHSEESVPSLRGAEGIVRELLQGADAAFCAFMGSKWVPKRGAYSEP